MEVRAARIRSRETSPDRGRIICTSSTQARVMRAFRKVQVVYYLSRNGQLEHPHFMEVCLFSNQQLRLKDVLDRLTSLRGKGMPSLYSWSCKRSYKNGYVWNDLTENDIICPTEGAEYVLKGSQLVQGCTEKFQQLHVTSTKQQIPEPNLHQKRKPLSPTDHHSSHEEVENRRDLVITEGNYDEDSEEEEEEEEKTSYTSSTTSQSRCSRGVATDEIEGTQKNNNPTELAIHDSSPPSTTESVVVPSRGSVLLNIIACGGSSVVGVKSNNNMKMMQKSNNSLYKGVVCKSAAAKVSEEEMMISCMSENPRFGNLQSEEKEYFSGSVVESMTAEERSSAEPALKRSNSYKEERSSKTEMGEAEEEDEEKREKTVMKGKCIPRKKSTSSKSKQSRK